MAGGPVEALAQVLEIDDVADEIEDVTARVPQEVEQQVDSAFARAQVDVGQPDGAERLMARRDLPPEVKAGLDRIIGYTRSKFDLGGDIE